MRSFLWIPVVALYLLAFPIAGIAADKSATVVMLTWRGATAAETSFIKTLEASGWNVELVKFDAGRNRAALAAFLRENSDVLRAADGIYTFGTLTARVVQSVGLNTVPHVFNIVADPVGTGLVRNLEEPGVLRTGAKVTISLTSVFQTLDDAIDFSSVAVLFDPRELTSEAQYHRVADTISAMGKPVKGVRFVPDTDDVSNQVSILKRELADTDLIFVPAASSFVAHIGRIAEVVPETAVIVGAVEAMVGKGATVAIAADFAERGRVAGNMMISILEGADPATIPVSEVPIEEAKIIIDLDDPRAARIDLSVFKGDVIEIGRFGDAIR
ncbi:ABC transporter substrate binding protein [Labrenzia sp. PHM005]|uniref:ABC transporter substrate binding protein n=1 Tax=Labrenzia sp. PHM005 TaxID=2590016 RepID=UPI0011403095|nr:ABC transporter substrate binding protein [Labrenzia sp. PHM005]QDG76912.1 hypothetical protein FJ695_14075 [Labrenzia sp. PHM005]